MTIEFIIRILQELDDHGILILDFKDGGVGRTHAQMEWIEALADARRALTN